MLFKEFAWRCDTGELRGLFSWSISIDGAMCEQTLESEHRFFLSVGLLIYYY